MTTRTSFWNIRIIKMSVCQLNISLEYKSPYSQHPSPPVLCTKCMPPLVPLPTVCQYQTHNPNISQCRTLHQRSANTRLTTPTYVNTELFSKGMPIPRHPLPMNPTLTYNHMHTQEHIQSHARIVPHTHSPVR